MEKKLLDLGLITQGNYLVCFRTKNLNSDDYYKTYFVVKNETIYEVTPNPDDTETLNEISFKDILMDLNDGFLGV